MAGHLIEPAMRLRWTTLKMLFATGVLYLIMMGTTFSSLGVVLPHMIPSLGMNFGQAGIGFTLLTLAAGTSSMLPAVTIRRWNARVTILLGVLTLLLAYGTLAASPTPLVYYIGATLLGVGFSMIGAVPALHILGGWDQQRRSLVFGAYLAMGGLGGALWPTVVETTIAGFGGWRAYWWTMAGLIAITGTIAVSIIRERPVESAAEILEDETNAWTLSEALRTPQFYIIASAIAATYLIASTVNAFTISYLTLIGVSTTIAVITFSIQSSCHAAFPLLMGGIAGRVGVKALLVLGLVIQTIGMVGLAKGTSLPVLIVFAIGVGGGYGTIFLATTLSLQEYFGRTNYPQIFGSNQLFTTVAVLGPALVGRVADLTGRFDLSFFGLAGILALTAAGTAMLRPPVRRGGLVPANSTG